jgi:Spy/CpxP family protein refolding chaperone
MRSVIRVSAAVLALFIAVNGAEAQGGGGGGGGGRGGDPAQMIQRQVDARMAGITLDAKQKATVDSLSKVMVEAQAKMMADMQAGGDRQAMMTKRTELNTKFYADIKAVLTPEQQAKFDENVKNLPQGRGRGGF